VCPEGEFKHIVWDDDGLRALVAEAFPEHLGTYDGYEQHIQRVDFARAAMLQVHGGLYVDMDVEVRRSPFPHLPAGLVSVVGSPYPKNERHQNSMMASPPRHPFWRAMAEEAVRRTKLPGQYYTTWQLTGPQLLDAVVDMRPEQVHVLPSAEFNPSAQSPLFGSPDVYTRHFCTSVWTHSMDRDAMRLYQAVRTGDLAGVSAAAAAGADLECRDYAGLTPLHHAAFRGDAATLKLLTSLRADVNAEDKNRTTPLHYAVQVCATAAVRRLVECRADFGVQLKSGACAGQTPVTLARANVDQYGPTPDVLKVLRLLDPEHPAAGPEDRQKEGREKAAAPWWKAARVSASAPAAAG